MYADRYAKPTRIDPAGLTAAIAINAALIAALMVVHPTITAKLPKPDLRIFTVDPIEPPPPEPLPKPLERAASRPTETMPVPVPRVPTNSDLLLPPAPPLPPLPPSDPPTGGGTIIADPPTPPAPLPYVEPGIDPRYARDLQPVYPANERRAEHEGRVTVRVLVGVDGRVKRAERISAASEDFWKATLQQAMSKWRFKPATRGGIPVEGWRTLSLTFVLEE